MFEKQRTFQESRHKQLFIRRYRSSDDTNLQLDLQPILHANLHLDLHTDLQNNLQDLQNLQQIYRQICRGYNIGESRQSINSSRSSSTSDLSIHKKMQWLILLESIRDQFLTGQMIMAYWNDSENGRRRCRFSSEVL